MMFCNRQAMPGSRRLGFTILEVMIALTASLLMMLALTRAFKLIGDRITQSQSELELSSTLRDVTFSLRDELKQLTPEPTTPQLREKAAGYFTYYEGAWAEGTTTLINNSGPQPGYLPTSRFGDFDDYLAFTAEAQPGAPFVGMIPRGILEAHRFERFLASGGAASSFVTYDGISIGSYTVADAFALVPFYSEYAEIAYFCTPQWVRDGLGQPQYDGSGNPLFVDTINDLGGATPGDNIPDKLALRRRVLLIRPDLNMTPRRMYSINSSGSPPGTANTDEDKPQVPILLPAGNGKSTRVRPLAGAEIDAGVTNPTHRFEPGPWHPGTAWAGVSGDAARPPWLTGLARVQQLMDLSVARIINDWSGPGSAGYGMPADNSPSTVLPANVTANSLESLSRPENRFAFVRMPRVVVDGNSTNDRSTMPLLALAPPHPYLTAVEDNTQNTPPGDERFGQAIGGDPPVYGNFTMTGFLRPEFALTDYTVADRSSATGTAVPTYRGGSDIVASDVLAFDVQVYDPDVPNFVWMGDAPANQPGIAGTDDDGDGTTDEMDELGLPNTNDVFVSVNSPAINPLVSPTPSVFVSSTRTLPPPSPPDPEFMIVAPGQYVDFGFARQAGGMMGGFNTIDRLGVGPRRTFHNLFSTKFSGLRFVTDPSNNSTYSRYPSSWSNSGRFVFGTTVDPFVQPLVDTWTETYDGDGFQQSLITNTAGFDATGSTQPSRTSDPSPVPVSTRIWRNTAETAVPGLGFEDGNTTGSQTTPPTAEMPRAVKISLRVYDSSAGEIRQQSVIHEFGQ